MLCLSVASPQCIVVTWQDVQHQGKDIGLQAAEQTVQHVAVVRAATVMVEDIDLTHLILLGIQSRQVIAVVGLVTEGVAVVSQDGRLQDRQLCIRPLR